MPRVAVDDNKRMQLRVRPEQKATLMRAAALRNTDLTDSSFSSPCARPKRDRGSGANSVIGKRQPAGAGLLENPPAPNAKLRAPSPRCRSRDDASGLARRADLQKARPQGVDCGDAELNDFLQRYARQSHDLGSAKPSSLSTTPITKLSSASTAWRRARSRMPTRRRLCGAALRSTMCRGSVSRALRRMSACKGKPWRSASRRAARRCLRAAAKRRVLLISMRRMSARPNGMRRMARRR